MMKTLLTAAFLLLSGAAAAEAPPTPKMRANIVYGSYSGLSLLMNVQTPSNPRGLALLHIPGSGFQAPMGMKPYEIKGPKQHRAVLAEFLAQGFTIFSINHRAAPRFRHPAPFEDAQRAARFIRDNAAEFGVSSTWLGVLGASSGGNLALMLGTLGEGSEGKESGPAPQCVAAIMAPTDFLPMGQEGLAVGMVTLHVGTLAPFPEEATLPGYRERLAPYQDASPITHLAASTRTRFLLVHGDADRLVPIDQSTRFVAKAKALGIQAELQTMPGIGHAFPAPYPQHAAKWLAGCAAETL